MILTVPILPQCKTHRSRELEYVALSDALMRPWQTRACTTQYALPEYPHRLVRDELDAYDKFGGVRMQLLIVDVDDELAHARDGATSTAEWRAAEQAKVRKLLAARPGGFVHTTPRGYRVVYQLAEPMILHTPLDGERWRASYPLEELRSTFGIVADRNGAKWGQTFDLPYAKREGSTFEPEVIGDASNVGTWKLRIFEPNARRSYVARVGSAKDSLLGQAFAARGWAGKEIVGGKLAVRCPWEHEHSAGSDRMGTATIVLPPTTERNIGGFHCSHAHCSKRTLEEVCDALGITIEPRRLAQLRTMLGADEMTKAVELAAVGSVVRDALRLAAPDRLIAVQVPPGAGKTKWALEAMAASESSFVYSLPRHDLGDEVEQRLANLGESVDRRRGLLRVVGSDGEPVCHFPQRARALQVVGRSVGELCKTCPHQKTCPARQRHPKERIIVAPHQLATIAMQAGDGDGTKRRLIADEAPELVQRFTLSADDLAEAARILPEFIECARAFVGVAREIRRALKKASASLVGAAHNAGVVLPTTAKIRKGERHLDRQPRLKFSDLLSLSDRRYARAIRAMQLARVLAATAHFPERVIWRRDGLVVYATTPEAEVLLAGGAVLLDATLPAATLEVLCRDAGMTLGAITVRVADAAEVERTILYSTNVSRSYLAPGRVLQWDRVRSQLAASLRRAVGRTLLVTHKVIADGLRSQPRKGDREHAHAVELLGSRVEVAHFGAVRGIDRWRDFDTCITFGDPIPEINEAHEQAHALGLDPETHLAWLARAELAQAHGRLRAPHRSEPATMIHVGVLPPLGWTTDNTNVVVRPRGRPRTQQSTSSIAGPCLHAWVAGQGGLRAAARELGVHHTTLLRYVRGERALPAEISARIPHSVFGTTCRACGGRGRGGAENTVKNPTSVFGTTCRASAPANTTSTALAFRRAA